MCLLAVTTCFFLEAFERKCCFYWQRVLRWCAVQSPQPHRNPSFSFITITLVQKPLWHCDIFCVVVQLSLGLDFWSGFVKIPPMAKWDKGLFECKETFLLFNHIWALSSPFPLHFPWPGENLPTCVCCMFHAAASHQPTLCLPVYLTLSAIDADFCDCVLLCVVS